LRLPLRPPPPSSLNPKTPNPKSVFTLPISSFFPKYFALIRTSPLQVYKAFTNNILLLQTKRRIDADAHRTLCPI
jgi:hypothetical protein